MLFADIKGSMELIEDLDPEEALAIVDPALKLMMEAVQRYDGSVPDDGSVPTTLSNIPGVRPSGCSGLPNSALSNSEVVCFAI